MPTPAQMRDRYRRIAHHARHLPGVHGLREHTVEVAVASWDGTYTGDGDETVTWTAVTERGGHSPKVRWLNDEQLALGALPKGTCRIGPITPQFSAGGTPLATLTGAAATRGQTFRIRITGPRHPDGALYLLAATEEDRALHTYLTAKPVADVEP